MTNIDNFKIINKLEDLDFDSLNIGDKFIELHSFKSENVEQNTINIGCLQYNFHSFYNFLLLNNNLETTGFIDNFIDIDSKTLSKNLNILLIENNIITINSFHKKFIYDKNDDNDFCVLCNLINNNDRISSNTIYSKKNNCHILKYYILIDMGLYYLCFIVINNINLNQKRLLQRIDCFILDKDIPGLEYIKFCCDDINNLSNALLNIKKSLSEEEKNKLDILICNIERKNMEISQIIKNETMMNKLYKSIENSEFDYVSVINQLLSPILVDDKYNYKAYINTLNNYNADIFSIYSDNAPIEEICNLERKAESILKYNTLEEYRIINIYTGEIINNKYKILYNDCDGIILIVDSFSNGSRIFFKKILDVYCIVYKNNEKKEIIERYETYKKLIQN